MTDRKMVIMAMECCAVGAECDHCPYSTMNKTGYEGCHQMHADALAMLQAQEPRVITLEEAKSAYVIEYRSGEMREVGAALLNLDVDPLNAAYGKVYRVWTSRPTDEQREATPWN